MTKHTTAWLCYVQIYNIYNKDTNVVSKNLKFVHLLAWEL
jgi:hypothetical protein